jgi:hypothetical protein
MPLLLVALLAVAAAAAVAATAATMEGLATLTSPGRHARKPTSFIA